MFSAPGATPSLFGGTPATPAPTPSLFGAPPATAGGFGGAQQQQQQTPSLFGAPKPAASPFGALGGGAAATPAPFGGGSSLFGGAAATPAPAGGSLFGGAAPSQTAANPFQLGAPGASLFGGAPAQQPAASSALGLGGFGGTGGSLFGGAPAQPAAQPQGAPGLAQQPPPDIFPLFRAQMVLAWDPASARTCAFRAVLFDDASRETPSGSFAPPPPDELARLRSSARAAADDLLWDRADARNPDPARLVPVQVTGFHALKARCEAQRREERLQRERLDQLGAQLAGLLDSRELDMRVKLGAYAARHAALSHRLLAVVGRVERLRERRKQQHQSAAAALGNGGAQPFGASQPAERPLAELRMRGQFGALLDGPDGAKALRARLHGALGRAAALAAGEGEGGGARLGAAPPLPHATAARLTAVLGQQQAAIAELRAVLDADARSADVLARFHAGGGGGQWQAEAAYY